MTSPNFADKTIWTGDNLDILRGMNSECVDLIYLDPPFNSNQNHAAPIGIKAAGATFKDTWTLSDLDVAWMGLIAGEQPAMAHVVKTAGLTHGKGMQSYLTVMVIVFFAAIAMIACESSVMPTESESSANPKQSEQSGPTLLLDEASAMSILQAYLQECVLGWDDAYADLIASRRGFALSAQSYGQSMDPLYKRTPEPTITPVPTEAYNLPQSAQMKKSWLMKLATGTVEGVAWSASYHGVTEVPKLHAGYGPSKSETWVVIGPGFDRPDNASVVPGRWKVYAGVEQVDYVDAPARLALEEYDSYNSCP